jgi:hypothetical protein
MKNLLILSLCSFVFAGLASRAGAQAGNDPFAGAPTEYSVDMATTREVGAPINIRMYIDRNKRRIEQETKNGALVVILRGDLNMMYTVAWSRKTYRVSPLDPKLIKSFDLTQSVKELGTKYEKVGTEMLNGEVCNKYAISSGSGTVQGSCDG